jgi:GNAT superfamily N-acetyltransferase
MTSPDQVRPAADVAGLVLRRLDDPAGAQRGRIRELHDRIAERHHWSSLAWSDRRWQQRLAASRQRVWEVVADDRAVGLAWLDLGHPEGGVEVAMFGLVPEVVGRGIGGAALALLVHEAWCWLDEVTAAAGSDAAPRRRVWLHTSSLDHSHALENYRARGFVVYDTRRDTKTLPVR